MKRSPNAVVLPIALTILGVTACSRPARDEPRPVQAHRETDHAGGHAGADEHDVSDLDRPIAELFAATCEHGVKAHRCAECRYEVGVVKAEAALFQGRLLETARVERRAVARPLDLTGEVRFDERRVAHVSTQAEGIIRKVHVTLGDRVKRGQPLLEIASVAVGEAQAAYLEALELLRLARRGHERIEALGREGIAAGKERLAARQELNAAQIRAEAALGKLTRLGMSPAAARGLSRQSAKGLLVLRAPTGGAVLEMHAVAGEVARVESSLATVGDNSAVWVWADLYERDIALVSREQARGALAAAITVKAFPGQVFDGTVDLVSPSMSESSRTVKARIAVPNPERRLLSGMFAHVTLFIPGERRALAVPRQAVLQDEGRAFVFVHHQGDYYVRRPVAVGRSFAGLVEITGGLAEGQVVVATGAFLMKSDVLRSKMGAGCAD